METLIRKPFQGIINIIRFNWHFYVAAAILLVVMMTTTVFTSGSMLTFTWLLILFIGLSILVSLAVSFYVYDLSNLYQLNWLDALNIKPNSLMVNIHAGFDETSSILSKKFPGPNLVVLDFYDPAQHTEVSIARARKAFPAYPGTMSINTSNIPLAPQSADHIFAILSAHEIRNRKERILFFRKLKDSLADEGKIVVAEHLRDWPNFFAYTIGFLHFFPQKEWTLCFNAAGLTFAKKIKITPFITAFILQKNGTAS